VTSHLVVNSYPTAKSLPIRAGIARGLFSRRAIDITLRFTDNSRDQRTGLADGRFDIVHLAVDNAVSMKDVDGEDVIAVMGGDSGMNEFFVQPDVDKFEDLRGGTVVVDAPDTAYALQAKQILSSRGLVAGKDYQIAAVGRGALRLEAMANDRKNTAAILNLPYSLEAREIGLKSLGLTTDFIGPYQAGCAFVMRGWAEKNGDPLVRYIASYIDSLRWVMSPDNHDACVKLLVDELGLTPRIAAEAVTLLRRPGYGFEPDAAFNLEAFRNTLALRSLAMTDGRPGEPVPGRYLDLQYYDRAMALVRDCNDAIAAPSTGS
jgi:ABC-type nitrate/sulfonate/bicarbonate transport system substrate-binding protein